MSRITTIHVYTALCIDLVEGSYFSVLWGYCHTVEVYGVSYCLGGEEREGERGRGREGGGERERERGGGGGEWLQE